MEGYIEKIIKIQGITYRAVIIMKKNIYLPIVLAVLLVSCAGDKGSEDRDPAMVSDSDHAALYIDQLYLFNEAVDPGLGRDAGDQTEENGITGAMKLTHKGNVIVTVINEPGDTLYYRWGRYQLTDSSLTYRLTDEYYYPGRWDAPLDEKDAAFSRGQTRKYVSDEVTLVRSAYDPGRFVKMGDPKMEYRPYSERKGEQFITWIIRQIPVLAEL